MTCRYYMACGKYPFMATTVLGLYDAVAKAHYDVPRGLDPTLANLISLILTEDAAQRYSIAQIRTHEYVSMVTSKQVMLVSNCARRLPQVEVLRQADYVLGG